MLGLEREFPAVELVDRIRKKITKKFEKRRKLSAKRKCELTPYADRCIKDICMKLQTWDVLILTDEVHAKVENAHARKIVNMIDHTCSCGK